MRTTRHTSRVLATMLVIGSAAAVALPATAAPAPGTGQRFVLDSTNGAPDGSVGDSGLGLPGGVDSTPLGGTTQWVSFESAASDLVAGDTNGASDVFVSDGDDVVMVSVLADGTQPDGSLDSYDPSICDTGRRIAFTTDTDLVEEDTNGAPDVYVLDRDADDDGTFDEFDVADAVSLTLVSTQWDADGEEYIGGFNGAGQAAISGDCDSVAFVTEDGYAEEDFNFLGDVYLRDLTAPQDPLLWVSSPVVEGGEGGGYLPSIDEDASHVVFATEGYDLVDEAGTVGGLIIRDLAGDGRRYVTITPNGAPSTALPDTEHPAVVTPDGACVVFRAALGYDLVAGNTAADGVFVWDALDGTPAVELVSKDDFGVAAVDAASPSISDDCRFVGFESSDDLLVGNDDNERTDVFVYDRLTDSVALMSANAGDSADAASNLGQVLWDDAAEEGQVLLVSGAPTIQGADGGDGEIDLFAVRFLADGAPAQPAAPQARAGNASATITWQAPDDGGSAITGYVVTATPGGRTCTTTGALTCTVTGLRNGTAYRFTVRAVNALGSSVASPQSSAVTPRTVPGAPRSLKAKAGSRQVTLTWSAPTSNGGAAITAYRVQSSTNGKTWKTETTKASTKGSYTVKSLKAGVKYSFRVAAINAAGTGADSSTVTSTPRR